MSQHAVLARHLVKLHAALGQVLLQVIVIVPLHGTGRDEIEVLGPAPVDGELRAHAAIERQHVAQSDAADRFRNAVRHETVEPLLGPWPLNLEFRERGHIQQARLLVHVAAFIADMLEIVRPPEAPLFHIAAAVGGCMRIVVEHHIGPFHVGGA